MTDWFTDDLQQHDTYVIIMSTSFSITVEFHAVSDNAESIYKMALERTFQLAKWRSRGFL